MRELIHGYATAVYETARESGRIDTVRDELAGFAKALLEHRELFQVLTDPTVPELTRRAIVTELLTGRATQETLALLGFSIRVERASELPTTLSTLVNFAGDTAGILEAEWVGGHIAVRARLRGYAERVLQELASNSDLDEVEDELFRIARMLDAYPSLRQALTALDRGFAAREAIAADLFRAKVRPATWRLVDYVLRLGRLRDLVGTFDWFVDLAAQERGRRIGEVRSAVELDEGERVRLAEALSRLVERPVEVRVIIDPAVVGGMLVSVGDLVIDGTIRLRLERLRDLLAPAS